MTIYTKKLTLPETRQRGRCRGCAAALAAGHVRARSGKTRRVGWFEELVAEADSVAQDGEREDAVALLEEALTLARASDEVAPLAVIGALASRAYELVKLGLWQRAASACDELLELISGVRDRRARRYEAWALLEKARALSALEQDESAIAVLELLLDRYGATRNQTIRRYLSGIVDLA
jgi:tetratricopeptide (TPR) repeat protein